MVALLRSTKPLRRADHAYNLDATDYATDTGFHDGLTKDERDFFEFMRDGDGFVRLRALLADAHAKGYEPREWLTSDDVEDAIDPDGDLTGDAVMLIFVRDMALALGVSTRGLDVVLA